MILIKLYHLVVNLARGPRPVFPGKFPELAARGPCCMVLGPRPVFHVKQCAARGTWSAALDSRPVLPGARPVAGGQ